MQLLLRFGYPTDVVETLQKEGALNAPVSFAFEIQQRLRSTFGLCNYRSINWKKSPFPNGFHGKH